MIEAMPQLCPPRPSTFLALPADGGPGPVTDLVPFAAPVPPKPSRSSTEEEAHSIEKQMAAVLHFEWDETRYQVPMQASLNFVQELSIKAHAYIY